VTAARLTALILVALGLALVAAGCGGDEGPQIPRDEARNIVRRLQEADRRLNQDPPVCGDLSEDSIPALEDQVANLPEETDEGIKETLRDGVDHLRSLVEAECAARDEEPDTETTTTEEEPPPETQTQPPETQTQPPETQTTPPTETTPTPPTPPDNPGNGNGNGNNGGGQPAPGEE
jgi:hypothetical protein